MKKITYNVSWPNGQPIKQELNSTELSAFLKIESRRLFKMCSAIEPNEGKIINGYWVFKNYEQNDIPSRQLITIDWFNEFAREWEKICVPLRELAKNEKMHI